MRSGKQQKIAIVIYSLRRAGAEKVASLLSQQFSHMGHRVTLIVFDGREQGYDFGGNLIDLQLPSKQHAGFLRKAVTLLRRSLHLRRLYHQQQFGRIIAVMETAAFPSILTGFKTIVSNHCYPAIYFTRFEWLLSRFLYPRADSVVMVSEQGRECMQQRLGLGNLSCIYNPIDFAELDRLAAEVPVLELDGGYIDGDYIIAVARLEKQKRLDRLLAAFSASKLQQQLKLLILGEGSLRQQLEQQIVDLKLQDKVLMPGNVANPFPHIRQARFMVLSSDHEGFPMALIEALALGVPVVATDCETGPREIIRNEVNGMLVPLNAANDIAGLAAAMDKLYEHQDLYQRLCQQARKSVQHLALQPVARQWLSL